MKKALLLLFFSIFSLFNLNIVKAEELKTSTVYITQTESKNFNVYDITKFYKPNQPYENILQENYSIKEKVQPVEITLDKNSAFKFEKFKLLYIEEINNKVSPIIFATYDDEITIVGKKVFSGEKPQLHKSTKKHQDFIAKAGDTTIIGLISGFVILTGLTISKFKRGENEKQK